MNPYIPTTANDRAEMLRAIGLESAAALFADIPAEIRLADGLALDAPKSEYEVLAEASARAAKNRPAAQMPCFLGAGVYDRLVPAAVRPLTQRQEFLTAYTPYQPEISQGTLQAIFEFQTLVCSLFGMDVANASMYDGPSACAEAALMAVRHTGRRALLVSALLHPEARAAVDAYAQFNGIDIVTLPEKDGITDKDAAVSALLNNENVAGVLIQAPNFLGVVEDLRPFAEACHAAKGLLLSYTADPAALALFESPGAMGADIAVGEGQSFGIGMGFGGPHLGLMAAKQPLMRKLPGRIVGETVDTRGRRAYVLTLQAREQHIRREKATSNICSNQGLNALTMTIHLSLLGGSGLREVAEQSYAKAHFLRDRLAELGFAPRTDAPFFDEFAVRLPVETALTADALNAKLLEKSFLGGYALGEKEWLVAVTEKRTRAEMDAFVCAIKEALS
ncbi:MAG: aminomethyl-transferring glycine dehydrogenase subunit GcvPA [Clostridiales Family XIII bacterium]|jgi:glycine dehydrogenase subunit 1|nr:aminomethyl-transferring glycine dehydrogenase subunit GcvPA [Clostridiales Family XIII bacterium]